MKRSIRLLVLPAILLGALPAYADSGITNTDKPNYNAYYDALVAPAVDAMPGAKAATSEAFASNIDERRGVPTFLWGAAKQPLPPPGIAGSPETTARWYVSAHAHRWNLPKAIAGDLVLGHVHDTGRGGIIVTFRQRVNDIEVYWGEIKVLMARNLELVAIAGAPRAGARELKGGAKFSLTPKSAIANAMNDLYGISVKPADLVPLTKRVADYSYVDLAPTSEAFGAGYRPTEPFRIKRVFFQLPNRLVPAYFLEVIVSKPKSGESDTYAYVISATDGSVLFRKNLKAFETFNYKVFADPDGRPLDGPVTDVTPHPTGLPEEVQVDFISPINIAMEGFNTNPLGQADPWLPGNAQESVGNNVEAYTDDSGDLDGFTTGDLRATLTGPLTFDRTFDPNLEPQSSPGQMMAAVTQFFYTVNWLHDRYYDSGFNEAAGNAQKSNLGRGGLGGDAILAEAQDGFAIGSLNNANMSTPADGAQPRMQMFVWSGIDQQSLTLLPASTGLSMGTAGWGPANFDVTQDAVVADDGIHGLVPPNADQTIATATDGCQPLINDVVGKIVVVDRGNCGFAVKTENVQNAGALGIVIANNYTQAAAGAPGMGGVPTIPITIAPVSTTFAEGNAIKAAILGGATQLRLFKEIGTLRDGTVDNLVIAHEWGHYIHHRLENCGLNQCGGMSEGWGDLMSLMMAVREGDNYETGTYADTVYVAVSFNDAPSYYGIRRSPYTTDMTKNGFTYKHVTDGVAPPTTPLSGSGGASNAEVHNIGEIWANAMFEGYVGLLKQTKGANPRYTYEQARRLMDDYVVAGMKATPVEASFNEQRDAVLAAIYAAEPLDMDIFATGFAKRGFGTCMVSPPKDSVSMAGAVESFSNQGDFAVVSVDVVDDVLSCDNDGVLDAEESGTIKVVVMNTGITTLSGTTVDVASLNPSLTLPGGQVTLPAIKPFDTAEATFSVNAAKGIGKIDVLDLKVDVANAEGCSPLITLNNNVKINLDNLANAANADDVESAILGWDRLEMHENGPKPEEVWAREVDAAGNHVWHGVDYSAHSDSSLESPELHVSATDPLVISFNHKFKFEFSGGTNWDGAVIEIAEVGQAWKDISAYVNPGYNGKILDDPGAANPLGNRNGFVNQSPGYPAMMPKVLNLGMQLAGKKVKIRFRIGADAGSGEFGWQFDDFLFQGITNTPFPAVGPDGTECKQSPVANAGADQTVEADIGVLLDASASSDPNNDPLTYKWAQTGGFLVGLVNPNTSTPTFLSPTFKADEKLTFEVTVSDGAASATDTVDIIVQAPVAPGTGGAGGASSGAGGAGGGAGGDSGAGGGTGGSGTGGSGTGGDGAVSSSSSSSSSSSGALPDVTPPADASCDCEVAGGVSSSGTGGALGVGLLGAAMLFLRRRRIIGQRSS